MWRKPCCTPKGLAFSSHAAVIAAFGREFTKTALLDAKYHRRLIDVQDTRNLGDYTVSGVSKAQAEDALTWAQEFIDAAEAYLKSG